MHAKKKKNRTETDQVSSYGANTYALANAQQQRPEREDVPLRLWLPLHLATKPSLETWTQIIIDCDRCRLQEIVWKLNCLSALTYH